MNEEMQIRAEAEKDADPRVDLAVDRTKMAAVRTLLAWVRTLLSLMTAGIAIDKGFAALHQARMVSGTAILRNSHIAGLLLTGSGTVLITFVLFNYVKMKRDLDIMQSRKRNMYDAGFALCMVILLIGILMLISMIFG
jgi:putative membrane protein